MTDVMAWTDEGRALVERELTWLMKPLWQRDDDRLADILTKTKTGLERYRKGREHAEPLGQAAIDLLEATIDSGCVDTDASAQTIAGAATILSRPEHSLFALAEQVIRARGIGFAVSVLVELWSLRIHATSQGFWVEVIDDDHVSAHDASTHYSKADWASYLRHRGRELPETRDELQAAITSVWGHASRQAKAALAIASGETKRINAIARELLANPQPWPHYGFRWLPHYVTDAKLLVELYETGQTAWLSTRMLHNVGARALDLFESVMDSRNCNKIQRLDWLGWLSNIKGPRTAKRFAQYAEKAPYRQVVRDYFARYPQLLEGVIAESDDELSIRLQKVQAAISKPTPKKKATKKKATKKKATKKKATKKKATKKKATKKKAQRQRPP